MKRAVLGGLMAVSLACGGADGDVPANDAGGAGGQGAADGAGGAGGQGAADGGSAGAGGGTGDPCAGVTCSDLGDCVDNSGQPECHCNPGYEALGLQCVPESAAYLFRENFEIGSDPFGFAWASGNGHQTGQRVFDSDRNQYVYHVNFHAAVTLYIDSAPYGTFNAGETIVGSVSGSTATVLQVEDSNHPGDTAEWLKVSGTDPALWDDNDVLTGPGGSIALTGKAYFDSNDTSFGHRLMPGFLDQLGGRIHFRAYVRYGSATNPYTWETGSGDPSAPNQRSHELKWPDIGGGDGLTLARIIAKHRASGTTQGVFRVYTPNGSNHNVGPLVSGQWYCIEFLVQDDGASQTVKIWVDNDDEGSPDYELTGSGLFNGAQWQNANNWGLGYRNHAIPEGSYDTGLDFYYDDIIVHTSFIGT